MQILSAVVCDEFYEDNSDIELEQAKAFVEKKHIDIENADYKRASEGQSCIISQRIQYGYY